MIRSDMMQMREIDSFRPTLRSILTSLRMRSLVMNYICHYGIHCDLIEEGEELLSTSFHSCHFMNYICHYA